MNDIEMAQAELSQLEQRFHLRIEHGQSGLPLTSRTNGSILDQPVQSLPTNSGIMQPGHGPPTGSEANVQNGQLWPPMFPSSLAPPINLMCLNNLLIQAIACQQQQQQQQQKQQQQQQQQQQQPLNQNALPWFPMQTPIQTTPMNLAWLANLILSSQQVQQTGTVTPQNFK